MTALAVGLSLVVLVLGVLVAGLLRSHAEILKALHELGAGLELDRTADNGPVPVTIDGVVPPRASGSAAPDSLVGVTLDGESVAFSLQGGATLLAFLSSGCTTCQAFWSAFGTSNPDVPAGTRLVVVVRDLDEESESELRKRRPARVPVVASTAAWDGLDVPGSPYFVLVRDGVVVGEGSGASWPQVLTLLGQASADAELRGKGAVRESRDNAALQAAGIEPGHPSLYEAS
ncbi:MAG: hypothetical protein QOI82_2884 [Actinomycetota bacterium]|jgi:hypothetical protein|nr:hypothetical protein [Actinomycetota bacterium]